MYEGMKGEYFSMSGRATYLTYVSSLVTASSNGAFYIVYISLPLCQHTKNASKRGGKASIEKGIKGALRI